jgi:hypothetical protein
MYGFGKCQTSCAAPLEDVNSVLDGLCNIPPAGVKLASHEILREDLQQRLQDLEGQAAVADLLNSDYIERQTFRKSIKEKKQDVGNHKLAA